MLNGINLCSALLTYLKAQSALQLQSQSHTHIHTLMAATLPNTAANLEPPGAM